MRYLTAIGLLICSAAAGTSSIPALPSNIEARQGGVGDSLHCFNVCYGINRTIVEQTIHHFCDSYDGISINKDGIAGTFKDMSGYQYYTPAANTLEKGEVFMEVQAKDNDACGTQVVPYNVCADNFWVTINQCNCCKEDGKQGGIWQTPCLLFIFSPNWNGCYH